WLERQGSRDAEYALTRGGARASRPRDHQNRYDARRLRGPFVTHAPTTRYHAATRFGRGGESMTIRWGIIGCGDVCERKSGPALQKAAGSALVAVMRRNGALA